MPEQHPPFESWAIVEMLGHKKLAGFVTEQSIAGAALIRVDVPATPEDTRFNTTYPATAEYSKLIGVGSIYAITPCTEDAARRAARELERYNDPLPVSIPEQRRLATATVDADTVEADDEGFDAGPWDGEG